MITMLTTIIRLTLDQWVLRETAIFLESLFGFLNYYILRDRIPFYVTFLYIVSRGSERKIVKWLAGLFLFFAISIGLVSIFYYMSEVPDNILTGFKWRYVAPVQYTAQILALSYLGWRATSNAAYSVALAYNGAAATGYLYEMPFWIYSISPNAHFLHTNSKFVFLVEYQIIAIGVFAWLLLTKGVIFTKKDLGILAGVFFITGIMASQMYVWETAQIARIPMILYSLYLAARARSLKNER